MRASPPRLLFLASLLVLTLRGETPRSAPPAAAFEGSWVGTISSPSDHADLGFTFTRGKHGLNATVSMPAMFVPNMPLGTAQIEGDTYTLPDLGIRLTLAGNQLTGTAFNPLLRVTLDHGPPHAAVPALPGLPPAPTPAWTHALGAETWASPVARDGLVYLGSVDGKFHAVKAGDGSEAWTWSGPHALYGDALVTADSVYFLDERTELVSLRRTDGQLQWRAPLHNEKLAGKPAPRNPTFNRRTAVPVVADGVLYIGSTDHGLYAVDATSGRVLWRHELGAAVFAAVALRGDELIAGCYDGSVVVLNRQTRVESARTKLGGAIASTPIVATDTLLVGCRDYVLYGLRRSDLSVVWRKTYWFSWVESVPRVAGGLAYIGGSDFRRISAIDPATGQARWATDVRGITWGSPAMTDDTVYAGTSAQNPAAIHHEGGLVALDRATGIVKWRQFLPLSATAERAGYIGSLALVDGRIIGVTFDGVLTAFPAK